LGFIPPNANPANRAARKSPYALASPPGPAQNLTPVWKTFAPAHCPHSGFRPEQNLTPARQKFSLSPGGDIN
jgi:hypothetical protein